MKLLTQLNIFIFNALNYLIPKKEQVIITGGLKADANAIEMANYVSQHYKMPVYYETNSFFAPYAKDLLHPNVQLLNSNEGKGKWTALRSKYKISTHESPTKKIPGKSVFVNLWHGVGHKSGSKDGNRTLAADITVATSDMVKDMFADLFNVSKETIFISGYPRNDLMMRKQSEKNEILKQLSPSLASYDFIFIWLPTFRGKFKVKPVYDANDLDFKDLFQAEFDVQAFNDLLKKYNAVCILKPHPIYKIKGFDMKEIDRVLLIDDDWIYSQKMSLYHLLAATDGLITDYSSVMIDYTLLNQPIVLFTPDFEEYKKTDGFYFDDVENWMPSVLQKNSNDFFNYVESVLKIKEDAYEEKRNSIRDVYFKFNDTKSAERLSTFVFQRAPDK